MNIANMHFFLCWPKFSFEKFLGVRLLDQIVKLCLPA